MSFRTVRARPRRLIRRRSRPPPRDCPPSARRAGGTGSGPHLALQLSLPGRSAARYTPATVTRCGHWADTGPTGRGATRNMLRTYILSPAQCSRARSGVHAGSGPPLQARGRCRAPLTQRSTASRKSAGGFSDPPSGLSEKSLGAQYVIGEKLPGGSQHTASGSAHHQFHPRLALEVGDVPGNSRLADVELHGRRRTGASSGEGRERSQPRLEIYRPESGVKVAAGASAGGMDWQQTTLLADATNPTQKVAFIVVAF
jgi:hypothetical protein